MTGQITVEIENRTLTPVIDTAAGATRRTVPLTTLVDNQQRAVVRIFYLSTRKRVLLREFDVPDLPPGRSGETRFLLSCDFDGRRTLKLHLLVDGKSFATTEINLARYGGASRRLLLTAALVVVAVLAAAVLLRGCGAEPTTPAAPRSAAPPVESAAPMERVAPTEGEPATPPPTPPPVESAAPTERATPLAPPQEPLPAPPQEPPPPPTEAPEQSLSRQHVLYFHADDPRLTTEARQQLTDLVRHLSTDESWRTTEQAITVRGHTALSGTEAGRIELSRQRAENSAAFLLQAGVVAPAQLRAEWYGAARLVTRDAELQHLNRRVEIILHGTE